MGEVYRARDTRIDRVVAIKILPAQLSEKPEACERFEREARAISQLSHANICHLYDLGQQDGIHYIVMEYLEGETLASRVAKGRLPMEQVLRYGAEIAEGLDQAHRSGVVHRDLKPGNIMLTRTGAKPMDFGLAKTATPAAPQSSGLSVTLTTPPASNPLTAEGTVIGTFQYMSPEQVEGQEADQRSDIFSFGAVLYEMATGKRAFEGKSQLSVASAILEKEPEPISATLPLAPPALQHVVQGALAKDPESRWQSAADIARQLRWISSPESSSSSATLPVHPRPRGRERALWAAVAALLGLLVWFAFFSRTRPQVVRASVLPPAGTTFDFMGDFAGPPELSPDGARVAFAAHGPKERNSIWVRNLETGTAQQLAGTNGTSSMFWSRDGRFLGFFADGKLKRVPSGGGPVTILTDAPNARGGSWSKDNVILFAPDYREGIWQVSASGGTPSRATRVDVGLHTTHRWPVFLPDGKHFLYFATNHSGGSHDRNGIYFSSLDSDSSKQVLVTDASATFAAGQLLFHQQNALLAQRFDPSNGTLSGDPIPLAGDVEYDVGTWHTIFTASDNGVLLYETGSSKQNEIDLVWMDREGKVLGHVGERGGYKGAEPSPDGKRLAVALGEPTPDIWIFDLVHDSRTRLTFDPASHFMPTWSPDGQRIAYMVQNGPTGTFGSTLHWKLSNGSGQDQILVSPQDPSASLSWPQYSPDRRYVVFLRGVAGWCGRPTLSLCGIFNVLAIRE
jgi:eukaryotic-like serine/threonine-protein kinase